MPEAGSCAGSRKRPAPQVKVLERFVPSGLRTARVQQPPKVVEALTAIRCPVVPLNVNLRVLTRDRRSYDDGTAAWRNRVGGVGGIVQCQTDIADVCAGGIDKDRVRTRAMTDKESR